VSLFYITQFPQHATDSHNHNSATHCNRLHVPRTTELSYRT